MAPAFIRTGIKQLPFLTVQTVTVIINTRRFTKKPLPQSLSFSLPSQVTAATAVVQVYSTSYYGYYWSSTVAGTYTHNLIFGSGYVARTTTSTDPAA
jgi:hypothetical protein